MSIVLDAVRAEAGQWLDKFRRTWVRPDDVRVTLLVRVPWLADGDFVVTDDDLESAIEALRKLQPVGLRPAPERSVVVEELQCDACGWRGNDTETLWVRPNPDGAGWIESDGEGDDDDLGCPKCGAGGLIDLEEERQRVADLPAPEKEA